MMKRSQEVQKLSKEVEVQLVLRRVRIAIGWLRHFAPRPHLPRHQATAALLFPKIFLEQKVSSNPDNHIGYSIRICRFSFCTPCALGIEDYLDVRVAPGVGASEGTAWPETSLRCQRQSASAQTSARAQAQPHHMRALACLLPSE